MLREIYDDVTDTKPVEVPEEFFDKTFIRHLMVGRGETSGGNDRVHVLQENYAEYHSNGTRYSVHPCIYEYGAKKYLTNLKNHMTMNLERFMIRTAFALYPGLSCNRIWGIIEIISNDRQHEDEIEFVDKKTSRRRKNEDSVIRTVMQEHRVALGWRIQQTRYQS